MSYWLDKNRTTLFLVLDLMGENSTAHFFVCDGLHLSSKYFSGQSTAFLDWSHRLYSQFLIPNFPTILFPMTPSLFPPTRFLFSSLSNLSSLLFLRPLKAEILARPHFSYVFLSYFSLPFTLYSRRHFPKGIPTPVRPDLNPKYYP
jgi:hypothetical protein